MPRRTRPHPGPECPPGLGRPQPARSTRTSGRTPGRYTLRHRLFLQQANHGELAEAYKALVGLLVGGEEGLDSQEVRVAREMYLTLQRELDRQLHSAIFPHGGELPSTF